MDDFWPLYWDWKYPATIIICLVAGFLAGYSEAKCRALREKREPEPKKTSKPVYLEDEWEDS